MAKRQYQKKKGPFYRINHFIRAEKVRVVDETGKQVNVLPISEALRLSREKGLDLVEVAPKANPPVCKIIDFKKFKFLENKKRQKEKKTTKSVNIKQVRLTPFIAPNDLKFRLERAKKFILNGDKVKISVFFRGREMSKKDFGYNLLKNAADQLASWAQIESEPKFVGRRLVMQMSAVKGKVNEQKQTKN